MTSYVHIWFMVKREVNVIWAKFFILACFFFDRNGVEVHKHKLVLWDTARNPVIIHTEFKN